VGRRKFFEILTSQIRHCDVHRGVRQILRDSGSRISAENAIFPDDQQL